MRQETEMMMELIEVSCPRCQDGQLFITGVITAFTPPIPDIFTIDCNKCGCAGSGYKRNECEGWKFIWDESLRSTSAV
jgi:uncharacterized protein (DUF983 family)